MTRLVTRRLAGLVAVLLVTSFLVYAGLYFAPGSPESFLLAGKPITPETIAAIRSQYHLDDPLLVQYFRWLGGALQGDFGRSLVFRQPVSGLLWSRLPTTAALSVYASVLIVVVGIGLGMIGALKRGKTDMTLLVVTTVVAGTPAFVAAIGLISLFAVKLGWFPTFGKGEGLLDQVYHLTLPAIALATSYLALIARVTRASMINELAKEHVTTARGRGIPEHLVVYRHGFRNALGPILTITGLVVAGLLTGTVVVEVAFGLGGIGALLIQSVNVKDFPVVQAIVLLLVTSFVVTNTIVDLLLAWIDPRLRRPS